MTEKKRALHKSLVVGACLICTTQFGWSPDVSAKENEASGRTLLFSSTPHYEDGKEAEVQKAEPVAGEITEQEATDPVVEEVPQSVQALSEEESPPASQAAQQNTELGIGNAVFSDDPVDLLADRVEYDEPAGIVSAMGNVELVQAGRILRAEKVSYNIPADKVTATGNVVLNEVTGDTYFADNVELKDKMKDGFVRGLKGVLADGSRFTAAEAEKIEDIKVIMRKASYTACEPCKANPSKPPVWQLKADKVTHHKDEKRISYEDATFEVYGRPILYTPYFSHPDGSIKRKSGFLTPTVGFDSDLGAFYSQEYYWSIAPNKDVTIGAVAMTEELPLVFGEYRHRFENAELKLDGGATYSSRTDRRAGQEVPRDKEDRGHLFGETRWDINDKWRAGSIFALVSDEQYLRQYDISDDDVLENKIYAERFSGRNYATGRMIRFKDIRVSNRRVDQPDVLPELFARFVGEPNSMLGGRWSLETSALGLHREGNDQDIARGTVRTGWQKRHVSDIGLVNTLDLNLRGDAYKVNDRDIASNVAGRSSGSSALRGFTSAHLQTGYPLAKNLEDAQMIVEPLAAITAGSNLNDNNDIPNEDSQDVFLDSNNIFNPNRFPGYDRIEDEVHATYGFRTGLYKSNGHRGEIFLGQSYRFDKDDNPFPRGSGLSEQQSDYVGNISADFGQVFRINYGMQLDNESFASKRHEIDAKARMGDLSLGTRYFYANALQGTDLDRSREQIRGSARYELTDRWAVFSTAQYDLARETEGLRKLSYGLDYQGQCVNFLVSGQRTLTRESSGDSGTEIMMRIGLKNLGQFETNAFTLGSDD